MSPPCHLTQYSKQQQTILFPRVPVFFFEEPADKKHKIGGGNWRSYYHRCTWYTCHSKEALGNHEQTGGGRLQKAATTRDRCVVHMYASTLLSRRATSPAPAQRKNYRYFSTSSSGDHEKTNVVFRRSPDRGCIVLTSSKKKTKQKMIFAFVRLCPLSTGTYHVCHIHTQKFHPTSMVCSF